MEHPRRVPGGCSSALILVAVVANLNLAVANVALPDIGAAFRASQTALDLVSVGFSVGLAGTVLYFGALGDRYGRKTMLLLGTLLAIPTSLLAAYAPNVGVLVVARVLGGVAAGMAFPTTLALITALWTGPRRTHAIALWSAVGGSVAALGPFLAGLALHWFWWGSCFLLTLPLAVVALVLAWKLVPAHVHETTDPGRPPGGRAVDLRHRRPHRGHQLRPDPRCGRSRSRHRCRRTRGPGRVLPATADGAVPSVRPHDRRAAGSSGWRRSAA